MDNDFGTVEEMEMENKLKGEFGARSERVHIKINVWIRIYIIF